MTADIRTAGAASHAAEGWHPSTGSPAYRIALCQLQARIVKAIQEGRWGKVKALQYLLTHSFSGKALAIRRVTGKPRQRDSLLGGCGHTEGVIWDPRRESDGLTGVRQGAQSPTVKARVHT